MRFTPGVKKAVFTGANLVLECDKRVRFVEFYDLSGRKTGEARVADGKIKVSGAKGICFIKAFQ